MELVASVRQPLTDVQPPDAYRNNLGPFDDNRVAHHSFSREHQGLLVLWRVVAGLGRLDRFELEDHMALALLALKSHVASAAREITAAVAQDGGPGELSVFGERGFVDDVGAREPIGGHGVWSPFVSI